MNRENIILGTAVVKASKDDASGGFSTTINNYYYGQELTGWVDAAHVHVSCAAGSGGGVTLSRDSGENIYYYFKGKKKSVSNAWNSPRFPASSGALYWLYSTDGVTFEWSEQMPSYDALWVAVVAPGLEFGIKLTHGVMDPKLHELIRLNVGGTLVSGGGLTADTYELATDTDAANTPGIEAAIIRDVDLTTSISVVTQGVYTHLYFDGNTTSAFDYNKALPYRIGFGYTYPALYEWDGLQFNASEVEADKYLNYYIVRIPVTTDTTSQKYRVVILQPQVAYDSLIEAQAETKAKLNWGDLTDIHWDFCLTERLIYHTDSIYTTTGKVQLVDYSDLSQAPNEGWNFIAYDKEGAPVLGREIKPGWELKLQASDRITLTKLAENDGVKIKASACWYHGATAESMIDVGVEGDYFLRTDLVKLYVQIVDGSWQLVHTFASAQLQSDWNQADGFALDYIKNKPTIPAAQVNSDWNATSGVAEILNKPTSFGSTTFIDLTDTDDTDYSGKVGYVPTVNSGATGLVLAAPSAGATTYIALTDTSDTSYTGKDKYVPMVDETNGELDLTESVEATFDLLSDTPASKTGQGGKLVAVNSGGTALEYVTSPTLTTVQTAKARMTAEGGFGIYITNKTGAATVKGQIVSASTAYDNAAMISPANSDMPIGVFYEAGVADGSEALVIVSGIADVLFKDTVAPVHGYVVFASGTAGRGDVASSVPSGAEHWREIGHVLESKSSGTNVTAKCVLHFN